MKLPLEWVRGAFSVFEVKDGDGNHEQLLADDIKELVAYANAYYRVKEIIDDYQANPTSEKDYMMAECVRKAMGIEFKRGAVV